MAVERLTWMARRLARMSPAEIAHRVAEAGKRRAFARKGPPPLEKLTAGRPAVPVWPGLRARLLAYDRRGELETQLAETVRQITSGEYERLGVALPVAAGSSEEWFQDPVTGGAWPSEPYCFDVPYRHVEDLGDVKFVWETNRLQHLQPMAALAALRGDDALAADVWRRVESWIDANPPYRGVNWNSGIELALRAVSLIVVASLLEVDRAPPGVADKLAATLTYHTFWIDQFPSLFSSANNHLMAELAGVFTLACLTPSLRNRSRYLRESKQALVREAGLQILDDGMGAEQSPTYAAVALEWLAVAAAAGEATGNPLAASVSKRFALGAKHFAWLLDVKGGHPRIGDDDESSVLFGPAEGYVARVADTLARLTGARVALPHVPPSLLACALAPPEPPPSEVETPSGLRVFENGGLSIARWRVRGRAWHAAFDHGPLGYLSIAGHGHADALAVWLHIDGGPLLVDAGTYLYHSGGAWRDRFRGTPAHNALAVNDADSSDIAGTFMWSRHAKARLTHHEEDSTGRWRVQGEHNGYVASYGVRHRRDVVGHDEGLAIVDQLLGAKEPQPVALHFLFHPSVTAVLDGARVRLSRDGAAIATIACDDALTPTLTRGQEGGDDPRDPGGWCSLQFGRRTPAWRLTLSGALGKGDVVETVIHPPALGPAPSLEAGANGPGANGTEPPAA